MEICVAVFKIAFLIAVPLYFVVKLTGVLNARWTINKIYKLVSPVFDATFQVLSRRCGAIHCHR